MKTIEVNIKTPGLETSIQSVGDLKARIKELKDIMASSEQGTQQYDQALKQLQQDSQKLTEINNATKQSLGALPGSYKEIENNMQALIEQYKTMAVVTDEDRQKQIELADQINKLNNQLKTLDAATGNYERNVGNYSSAFEGLRQVMDITKTASEQLGSGFTSIGGIIATTTGTATGLSSAFGAMGSVFDATAGVAFSLYDSIDKVNIAYKLGSDVLILFKGNQQAANVATQAGAAAQQASATASQALAVANEGAAAATVTATTATKGFTKALLANPITLIITAIVALIANLDKLVAAYKAIKNWITGNSKAIEENAQKSREAAKAASDLTIAKQQGLENLEKEIELLEAQGVSELKIIEIKKQKLIAMAKEHVAHVESLRITQADLYAQYKAGKAERDAWEAAWKAFNQANQQTKEYNKMIRDLDHQTELVRARNHTKQMQRISDEGQAKAKQAQEELKRQREDNSTKRIENLINITDKLTSSWQSSQRAVDNLTRSIERYESGLVEVYARIKADKKETDDLVKTQEDAVLALTQRNEELVKEQNRLQKVLSGSSLLPEQRSQYLSDLDIVTKKIKETSIEIENENTKLQQYYDSSSNILAESTANFTSLLNKLFERDSKPLLTNMDDFRKRFLRLVDQSEVATNRLQQALVELEESYKRGGLSQEQFFQELKEAYESDLYAVSVGSLKLLADEFEKYGYKIKDEEGNYLQEFVSFYRTFTQRTYGFVTEYFKQYEIEFNKNLNNLTKNYQGVVENIQKTSTGLFSALSPNQLPEYSDMARALGIDPSIEYNTYQQSLQALKAYLEQRLSMLKEFISTANLPGEMKTKYEEQILQTQEALDDTIGKIGDSMKKGIQSQIAQVAAGVTNTLTRIQKAFNQKMDLAKTKADKIRNDTSLSAEQQQKLLAEQQEEYNKAFEANKKLEYANTVINTATSAMEAYKAMAGIPFVGPALGAAAAAAAVAAGVYQLMIIKNTQPDDITGGASTSDTSSSTPTIDINALLNQDQTARELDSSYYTSLQSQSTRVYVLQSDIEDTNNKVKTQVRQSSF